MKNQSCLDSAQSKKGSMLFKGMNTVPLLNQRKGSCYSKVSIQSLCSIKERVHTIQRYQFNLFAQSKKGSMLFKEFYINKDGCVFNVTFQKKILAFVSKNFYFFHFFNIFLLCNPFHVSEESVMFGLFAQSKKGSILFKGINSVSLHNQRKDPCYSKNSI